MRHCDECRFSEQRELRNGDIRCLCAQGHQPVFLAPQSYTEVNNGNWGWQLRCRDFQAIPKQDDRSPAPDLAEIHAQQLQWRHRAETLETAAT